jgi:hypothetical protein
MMECVEEKREILPLAKSNREFRSGWIFAQEKGRVRRNSNSNPPTSSDFDKILNVSLRIDDLLSRRELSEIKPGAVNCLSNSRISIWLFAPP